MFIGLRGEIRNISGNKRPGGHLVFPIVLKNIHLVEDFDILLPNKTLGGHRAFPIDPKTTNLVEDVEALLSVKFR